MNETSSHHENLEQQVNTQLVLSLYEGQSTSFYGVLSHVIATTSAWGVLRDPVYLWCVAAIILIFLVRMVDMRLYAKARALVLEPTGAFAHKWEMRYLLGTGVISVWMGLLTSYSMIMHTYTVAAYVAIGISFGTMTSVVGRNFGSKILIDQVIWLGCLPMAFSMVYNGYSVGSYWMAMIGTTFIPFIFMSRKMAMYVRDFAAKALKATLEFKAMAIQFDAAIKNQPNGMIMFDQDRKVAVINPQAKTLLGLPPEVDQTGVSIQMLMERVMRAKNYTAEQFEPIRERIDALRSAHEQRVEIETNDGRFLEFTSSPADDSSKDRTGYQGAVVTFQDVTSRVEAERKNINLARYDTLSELSLRGYFQERIADAVKNLKSFEHIAISVFDIDRFKLINDTLGHNAGDNAIKFVADKLRSITDKRAIYGRHGGDEFVIAFTGLTANDDVSAIFDDVFNRINSSPYTIKGHSVDIRVSGGVYEHRRGPFDLGDALSKADTALRKVKKEPAMDWSFFTRDMEQEHTRTLTMKAAISEAIANNDFKVVYQPMYRPDGSGFDCCEALARWQHPTLGNVKTDDFIRIAEEVGSIGALTRQILYRACVDCNTWPNDTCVSVNLSTLDLNHPEIISMVKSCLSASGLHPNRLQIEVTETVFVNDFEKISRTLHTLSNLGIKIALDDFGTGYSSLSYLMKLKVDKVKIDRSFVISLETDQQARLLFNGIVRMSKEMKFEVVVEGVETDGQLAIVTETRSVDRIQGYYFSKPTTTESIIEKLVEDNNPTPPPMSNGSLISIDDYQKRKRKS